MRSIEIVKNAVRFTVELVMGFVAVVVFLLYTVGFWVYVVYGQ